MPEPSLDLLDDPLLEVRASRAEGASLPEVLARLAAGEDLEFNALQAHQQHSWHAFLVQVAALAAHHGNLDPLPEASGAWKDALLGLSNGQREAWCLVVPDLAEPAFFQPPVPEGSLDGFKRRTTPDSIDVLVTTRNHEVKQERVTAPRPEHWVYSLVSVQTMEGYSGKFNYGIVRMNSGYGSRPAVGFIADLGRGRAFLRDIASWRRARRHLIETYGYREEGGHALLWTLPWQGDIGLALQQCDPFFIEICRRLRLVQDEAQPIAFSANSRCERITPGDTKGDTGDVWTPVRREDGAALSIGAKGFSYDLIQELLLSGTYELGEAARLTGAESTESWMLARGFARGQKTEGYHERLLPIPAAARRFLMKSDERERLGAVARRWVEIVAEIRRSVLRPALCALLQEGQAKLDFRDQRVQTWLRPLDRKVDQIFFPRLWESVEADLPEEADNRWTRETIALARGLLEEAIRSAPLPSVRKYRAIARAERVFNGATKKRFGGALGEMKGETPHDLEQRSD